ncbi:exonuclease SbcC [Ligilactobacillus sp. WILCCON 0076]|uniref:Exonuclease SbcC n=1 Tax=Ligilactobacillus ubinensis TaxID=2876789 RepID=A0A9X2JKT6_9LACO|nr:exonuclease SbcC [Ligilactobacillus ubinensis]MCP0886437.1 exonuclease SbcC [Ligilactobacillus ubinensis]
MANSNQFSLSDHNQATKTLTDAVVNKIKYLQALDDAVKKQDDRLVYQLIDGARYAREIMRARHGNADAENEMLIKDIHAELSDYLSGKLIAYLKEKYPFFYFEEIAIGQFQIYFGNWWGRRMFGTLDVLNVSFNFDEIEYQKLTRSFALEAQNKRLNSDKIKQISESSDRLQALIDSQEKRDLEKEKIRGEIKRTSQEKSGFWKAAEQKDAKQRLVGELTHLAELDEQANSAYREIRENEERVLALSKEDTLMGYEKQSIIAKFSSFAVFEEKIETLYRDYIASLIAAKGVDADA